jgi:hypothetical protein
MSLAKFAIIALLHTSQERGHLMLTHGETDNPWRSRCHLMQHASPLNELVAFSEKFSVA